MTPTLTLPNVAVCVCVHAVRRRGWGERQNHDSRRRAANTYKPSYQVRERTTTTTTTNYILELVSRLTSLQNNANLTLSRGVSQ